ncbi:MAG: hypothetical protein HN350_04130 [Phycisphaerales bacterium]|jgi:hypothetical protein|nr:hypothetical protein [Phycisphaerales bacterium]
MSRELNTLPLRLTLIWIAMTIPAVALCGARPDAKTVDAEHARIKARYVKFLIGTDKTFSGKFGKQVYASYSRRISGLIKRALTMDLTKGANQTFDKFPGDDGFDADAKIASTILERHLLALAYGYSVRGIESPYYRSEKLRLRYLQLLEYLHARGVRRGMTFHNNRHRMNMKGAPKPTGGAGNLVSMELRMGAYCQSLLIMEPHVSKEPIFRHAAALVRFLEMLGKSSGHVRYYEPYRTPIALRHWVQSDAIQIYSDVTLVSAMLETDTARRAKLLDDAKRVFSDSLKVTDGWADTIKPDFVGYHHRGIYGNAYTGGFIPQAAFGVYVLGDTSFAVDKTSVENLKKLMLTYRLYCQKYSMPFGIRGRMPHASHQLKSQALSGFAIYASGLGLNDASMRPVFARLWDSGRVGFDCIFAGGRGKLFRGLGVLDMLEELNTGDITPEPDPEGFWFKPYGGLAIHRRDNWLAAVKGSSKYIWDYETGKKNENRYGQYLSGGMLTIFASGNPVSDIASGYNVNLGWDWYRLPGVTAVHFPIRAMDKPLDHRWFSDATFLGGASIDNRNGVFGMILDLPKFADKTSINLKARKSVFFADDLIVMLGTGISGGDGKHPVETTIFQSCLTGQNANAPLLNAQTLGDGSRAVDSAPSTTLVGPFGNGYYLPDAKGLKVFNGVQRSFKQDGRSESKGDYAIAWMDHGLEPKNASYEVAIGVGMGQRIETVRKEPQKFYRVQRKDNRLHQVQFPATKQTAYVIFEPHKLGDQIIDSVNAPCLIVAARKSGRLTLGVTNPDLAIVKPDQHVTFRFINEKQNQFLASTPQPVTVTLNGRWRISPNSGANVKVVKSESKRTTLLFNCRNGMTERVELIKSNG